MARQSSILLIDDEPAICYAFRRYFEARGRRVVLAASAQDGWRKYRAERPDVVFLDVRLPDRSGLELLADIRGQDADALVVVITAYGSLDTVAQAMRVGAFDYLVKPLDLGRAEELVGLALQSLRSGDGGSGPGEVAPPPHGPALVGASRPMQEVYKRIARAAAADASVLITGETGTGKELVARAIHAHSRRADKPFVALNAGAIPEQLVEGELFGYVRGAYTGAHEDKPGRLELAEGGALLLDEVGDLPLAVQVKLLRFLDLQTVERLGSVESTQLDVRILAATNQDLGLATDKGAFRADLFYRLAVIRLELPPLRERRDDIPALASHFLRELTEAGPPPVDADAMELLQRHHWPGNVRELRNAMEHALVASGGRTVLPSHLPAGVGDATARHGGPAADTERMIQAYLDAVDRGQPGLHDAVLRPVEAALIRRVLAETSGARSAAAARLGIHRNTLRQKLRSLGLSDADAQ